MTSISSGSSNSSLTTSSLLAKTGYGGLVSGLDIDSLVEDLTATSREKVTRQEQNLQKLEWKQEAYRAVISSLSEFQKSYLDVLSSTNLRSAAFFNTVEATSSSGAISVSPTSSSGEGSFIINSITQLATAETVKSSSAVSKEFTGTNTIAGIESSISDLSGKSFKLTLDGKVKTITIDSNFISDVGSNGLVSAMQTAVNNAFGYTGVSDEVIKVSSVTSGTDEYLSFTAEGSTLKINSVGSDTAALTALGFTDGQSNKLSAYTALGKLNTNTALEPVSAYKFAINGVSFEFSSETSLSRMISAINSSSAGVTLSYSDISDTFTLTADETGAGDNIVISETSGNLLTAFGLTAAGGAAVTAGKNAILTVDGKQITRSSNNITLNEISVELKETTAQAITVTMKADSASLADSIKKFVEDYNTMIDLINTYIKENVESDYKPLTDKQKDEMTESQIEKWEAKAKSGILRGDATLRAIASKLQQTMYKSAVSGGISLNDLGITSAGYDKNGKLEINEDKLKTALKTKSTEIAELFTSDKGLANSIKGIIDGAVKTSGPRGSRGVLVEIAGVKDTTSATQNNLYKQIQDTEKLIDVLNKRLSVKESKLWARFSAMETALNNLNIQSSMISSFGSSS